MLRVDVVRSDFGHLLRLVFIAGDLVECHGDSIEALLLYMAMTPMYETEGGMFLFLLFAPLTQHLKC